LLLTEPRVDADPEGVTGDAVGIYPGLSEQQLEFSARKIEQFFGLGFE